MAKATRLPIDVSDLSLTPGELKFVGVYCSEANMDEVLAYKKAFPGRARDASYSEIRLDALDLLNKRDIKLAVQRFTDSVLGPWQDKLSHQLLSVLRTRAFYDIGDFFHADGSPKRLTEIPLELRVVIDGITQDAKGKNADMVLTTLKLGDRVTAMKMLQDLLKKKEDADKGTELVPDDARKQIRDVFMGIEKGLSIAKRMSRPQENRDDDTPALEHHTENVITVNVPKEDIVDLEIETSPIVKGAKSLASKEVSGIGVEEHPAVDRARDIARQIQAIRGK